MQALLITSCLTFTRGMIVLLERNNQRLIRRVVRHQTETIEDVVKKLKEKETSGASSELIIVVVV